MALLEILHHPDPRLREMAQPVENFGADLQALIADMFETMYDAPGVGLAAPQVGIPLRVAVMDCGGEGASGAEAAAAAADKEWSDPLVHIVNTAVVCHSGARTAWPAKLRS